MRSVAKQLIISITTSSTDTLAIKHAARKSILGCLSHMATMTVYIYVCVILSCVIVSYIMGVNAPAA